ncbi:MAG TPA: hypothetical protein VHC90_06020, partial [Bryobacteraceae bacterium]|nr:hypothetical protein [Bryobacteraceae bacterium]
MAAILDFEKPGIGKRHGSGEDDETTRRNFEGDGEENQLAGGCRDRRSQRPRRMREGYQQFGYTGLMDRRKGKQSSHRVPMETAEEVLRLYRDVYFDLNIRHHRRHHFKRRLCGIDTDTRRPLSNQCS